METKTMMKDIRETREYPDGPKSQKTRTSLHWLKRFVRMIFPRKEPIPVEVGDKIWIMDYAGEIRSASILGKLPDGRIVTEKIIGKIIGNADGTFTDGYCKEWFLKS